jgi:molybdopterin-guanine dinucleotide biosynthesis protein A
MAKGPLLGICIGGRGRRMGGAQKALLTAPDGQHTLIARLLGLARELGLEVVLLGTADLGASGQGVLQLPDAVPNQGPLVGLASLLAHAAERDALCLACDLPYVTAALLGRLAETPSAAEVLAPRDSETGKWQSLFARFASPRVAPALQAALHQGERSFQRLFRRLQVDELPLTAAEYALLRDWDTPEDLVT